MMPLATHTHSAALAFYKNPRMQGSRMRPLHEFHAQLSSKLLCQPHFRSSLCFFNIVELLPESINLFDEPGPVRPLRAMTCDLDRSCEEPDLCFVLTGGSCSAFFANILFAFSAPLAGVDEDAVEVALVPTCVSAQMRFFSFCACPAGFCSTGRR